LKIGCIFETQEQSLKDSALRLYLGGNTLKSVSLNFAV